MAGVSGSKHNVSTVDKNRLVMVAGATFTAQTTCPIGSGDNGFWRDSQGDLKRRNADGSDTLIAAGNAVSIVSVDAVSTSALASNTYANGTAGVGATLTAAASGTLTIDGVSMTAGKIALLTSESAGENNGVYSVTTAGTASVPYVLTRLGDFDESAEMLDGTLFVARAGTTNADTTWKYTTASAPTVGTTSLSFSRDPGVVTTNSAQTVSGAKTWTGVATFQGSAISIGLASSTLGFFSATASALLSSTGSTAGFTAGTGAPMLAGSTYTGGVGSAAYTFDDVVGALKTYGLIAS